MDRIISMVVRMFLGRGMRAAMSEGNRRQSRRDGGEEASGPDPRQARQTRQSSKNARQAMRVMRRMGRF
ncbi:hypothetical protein [Histidinibacterium lentulum]|uniref:Uncharacterized protein n=1 Tax=Histidinibacterium lentulum TaxID=2480588 RepID=A0A3N2RA37_9RHOB|nr:hypothetical protein [Histidinibacterium lentulum]ROU04275.1 hypothetical protein EAT49_02480 [Histidinibacterium lentulum]